MTRLGEWRFLIRVPSDAEEPLRFVATNETTAAGARAAEWEVLDLEALLALAQYTSHDARCDERFAPHDECSCGLADLYSRLDLDQAGR